MRLWLTKSGELTLRQQLTTQIIVAILSGELPPKAKLPSTRELAQRFDLHPNTISAAYRELEAAGWVEHKHGSGVFVARKQPKRKLTADQAADQLIGEMLSAARKRKIPYDLLKMRLSHWSRATAPTRWLLIEPAPELARIIMHELKDHLRLPIDFCSPETLHNSHALPSAHLLVLPSKADAVRAQLPPGTELTVLRIHPISTTLSAYLPAPKNLLIGIASHWNEFVRIASTLLVAAGFQQDSLITVDATKSNWKRGLKEAQAVVCDALSASQLPRSQKAIVFTLLDSSVFDQLTATENNAI